jgi:hypothetical protein
LTRSVPELQRLRKSLKVGRKSLKSMLERGRLQPMQILFIYEPAEGIGMPSGGKASHEKRIGSQERLACKLLLSFGSADPVKKRFSPIHHSEKEIRAPAGIGKGIESICEPNPEILYRRGKPFEDPGFRAGLPLALLAIVDPVPQINPIVLTGVE